MSNRYDDIIYDMYKDAYGTSPSGIWGETFSNLSDAEQDGVVARLQSAIEESIADDDAQDIASIQDYEENISRLIEAGANYRERAVAWILDGLNVNDADSACYALNLPYYPCKASPSGFAHEFDTYFNKKGN